MSTPITPSKEQLKIVKAVKLGYNVIGNAVAGSGKSTTIRAIARYAPDKKILVLTFNARLKIETREKIAEEGLDNVEVHTYHSFAVNYYTTRCHVDQGIIDYLAANEGDTSPQHNFDLIIVDEAQDITMLYFRLLRHIVAKNDTSLCDEFSELNISDNIASIVKPITDFTETLGSVKSVQLCVENKVQLCFLGDSNQNIYRFKGADPRFLEKTNLILQGKWTSLPLSTSYRLVKDAATFINVHMLAENRIQTVKTGGSFKYLYINVFGNTVYNIIVDYLHKGYKPEDIFILAPSIRAGSDKSPLKRLISLLSAKGYKMFAPTSDEEKLDSNMIAGKIVASSFHQVKGLERKIVVVMGFDASYFQFFNKDASPDKCPNELYVACTRSLEHTVVVHNKNNAPLPFLKLEGISRFVVGGIDISKVEYVDPGLEIAEMTLISLLRHLRSEIVDAASKRLLITQCPIKTRKIKMPLKIKLGRTWEAVSDLLELAFVVMAASNRGIRVLPTTEEYSAADVPQTLRLCNEEIARCTGLYHKTVQITSFDWLTSPVAAAVLARLENEITGQECDFTTYADSAEKLPVRITTIVPIHTASALYLPLCVEKLEPSHAIRAALMLMLLLMKEIREKKPLNFRQIVLLNLVNGERWIVEVRGADDCERCRQLKRMAEVIINSKRSGGLAMTDEEFIASCRNIV